MPLVPMKKVAKVIAYVLTVIVILAAAVSDFYSYLVLTDRLNIGLGNIFVFTIALGLTIVAVLAVVGLTIVYRLEKKS